MSWESVAYSNIDDYRRRLDCSSIKLSSGGFGEGPPVLEAAAVATFSLKLAAAAAILKCGGVLIQPAAPVRDRLPK